jgi:hypothetical protein
MKIREVAGIAVSVLAFSMASAGAWAKGKPGGGGGGGGGGATCILNGKLCAPTLTPQAETQETIDIAVTAGASPGAPAGFSLQWTIDTTDPWPLSDSPSLCKASFSGNAKGYHYNLAEGETVVVRIGLAGFFNDDGTLIPGGSTNCPDLLVCGTTYRFRGFAHAGGGYQRSDFSGDATGSTVDCGSTTCRNPDPFFTQNSCTSTLGFWKTHGLVPNGNNWNQWPVESLTLGTNVYTASQLLTIVNSAPGGNVLLQMARQLIAAKFNIAAGASDAVIATAIVDADALIGATLLPEGSCPTGAAGSECKASATALTSLLSAYNEGLAEGGPAHCDAWCQ